MSHEYSPLASSAGAERIAAWQADTYGALVMRHMAVIEPGSELTHEVVDQLDELAYGAETGCSYRLLDPHTRIHTYGQALFDPEQQLTTDVQIQSTKIGRNLQAHDAELRYMDAYGRLTHTVKIAADDADGMLRARVWSTISDYPTTQVVKRKPWLPLPKRLLSHQTPWSDMTAHEAQDFVSELQRLQALQSAALLGAVKAEEDEASGEFYSDIFDVYHV